MVHKIIGTINHTNTKQVGSATIKVISIRSTLSRKRDMVDIKRE